MNCGSYLSNIVHPEKGVCDEETLDSTQLMRCLHMAGSIESPGRVASHHVIEGLQGLCLLCSLGVLQATHCQLIPDRHHNIISDSKEPDQEQARSLVWGAVLPAFFDARLHISDKTSRCYMLLTGELSNAAQRFK